MSKVSNVKTGPAGESAPAAAPAVSKSVVADHVDIVDKRGRGITIKRIGPLARSRLFKIMGPQNSANVMLLGYYQFAASVTHLDGEALAFPSSEKQIEALLERLGDEGIEAIAQGYQDAKWVDMEQGDPANIKN